MVDEPDVPNDDDYILSPTTISTLTVELRQGTTLIATRVITPSALFETTVITLTGPEAASITNWADLALWFDVDGDIAKLKLTTMPTPLAGPVYLYIRTRAA